MGWISHAVVLTLVVMRMAASGKDGGGGGGGRLKAFHRNHAGLTDIPRDIPPHSGVINLSKNKISILRAGRLRNFTNCQALDLSYNNIALIEPGSFEGLGSVKNPLRLFLSNNYLENSIRSEMWKGLKNVLRLEVAFNKITHLRRGMFLSLAEAKLKELNLGANNILQIAEGSFAGLSTLRFLRLSDNQLKHLKPSMFSGLEMIMYLFLEENKISLIGEGTFANLKSLHRLCLTGNKLKSLNGLAFNHPTRHLQLELRENPLECSERLCWIKKSLSGGHVEKIDKAECNTLKDKKLVKSHLAEQCPEPVAMETNATRGAAGGVRRRKGTSIVQNVLNIVQNAKPFMTASQFSEMKQKLSAMPFRTRKHRAV